MKDYKIIKHQFVNLKNKNSSDNSYSNISQAVRFPRHSPAKCARKNTGRNKGQGRKKHFCMAAIAAAIIAVGMAAGCAKKAEDGLTQLKAEHVEDKASPSKLTEEAGEKAKPKPSSRKKTGEKQKNPPKNESQTEDNDGKGSARILVHVCGAVNAPGVYELDQGSRVYEAIAKAGGLRADAAGETLNQAKMANDGEQIYVPGQSDLEKEPKADGLPEVTGSKASKEGKVNINTSTKEELRTLPGIGEAKAKSIISHREANGPFTSIEDLMQVEGIKEGVYNKIKDRITS